MDSDFEKVYKEYFRDVYLYAKHLSGGDEQLAEDITSETFFRALRAAGSFRGECSVRAWLCRIAKNCLFSYCKKSSQEFAADDDVLDLKASSDEDPSYKMRRPKKQKSSPLRCRKCTGRFSLCAQSVT